MQDELRSQASALSQESMQGSALNVIRFNTFDEILFTMLYTFHKEPPFSSLFYILEVLLIVIQNVGVSWHWHDWPLRGAVHKTILDIFSYLSFQVSWRSDTFLIVLTVMLGILILGIIIGMSVCAVLTKHGSTSFPMLSKVVNILSQLITSIFFLPCINVFIGSLLCYTQTSNPETIPHLTCKTTIRLLMLIIGLVLFLTILTFSLVFRLFIFNYNHKKGKYFTLQYGFYIVLVQISGVIISVVGLALRSQKIIISIVGLVLFALMTIYPVGLLPFFHSVGNTIWATGMSIIFVFYLISIFCSLLDTQQSYVSAIIWILFFVLIILVPTLISILTYKRSRHLWAMREDEELPNSGQQKEELTILALSTNNNQGISNQQSQTLSSRQSSRYSQRQDSNNNINNELQQQAPPLVVTKVQVALTEAKPLQGTKQSRQGFGTFQQGMQARAYQGYRSMKLLLPEQRYEQKQLKQAPVLKKYKTVFEIENAIKFLSLKEIRKRQDILILGEAILAQGQKKFIDDSHFQTIVALFHLSFTKNNIKMAEALRTSKQNLPNILERWLVYSLMHDMERNNTNKTGANSLGVQFRLQLAKATKEYEFSKAYLSQAYLMLTKENMDLEKIMIYLDQAIISEQLSRDLFEQLMKYYPDSTQLMRGYAALLRDIYREDETALSLFNEANAMEEDNGIEEKGDKDQGGQQKGNDQQSIGGFSMGGVSIDGKSQSSGISNNTDVKKKKKKKRNQNESQFGADGDKTKQNLIPGFLEITIICMLFIVAALIVIYVLVSNNFTYCEKTVQTINYCTECMVTFLNLYNYAKYFTIAVSLVTDPTLGDNLTYLPTMDTIKKVMNEISTKLKQNQESAYTLTNHNSIFKLFEYPDLQIILTDIRKLDGNILEVHNSWMQNSNLIDLMKNMANIASDMSTKYWIPDEERSQNWLYFLRTNLPITGVESVKRLALKYSDIAVHNSYQSIIIAAILSSLALFIPILINVVQFYLTVVRLKKERYQIFLKLALTPKLDFLLLKKKIR